LLKRLPTFVNIRLKVRILEFCFFFPYCISKEAQPDQSLYFLRSWPWTAERNHKTGTPTLIRSVLSWDADKRRTDPVFFVAVLLDGTCPLQSSSLRTQVVSAGLSTEMLEGP
jgi:hypothetical protein